MQNKEILKLIKLNASLLELHNENEFKIRSYSSAAYTLDKINLQLSTLSLPELEKLQGVGKSIAGKIFEISQNNTFSELQELLAKSRNCRMRVRKPKIWKRSSKTGLLRTAGRCARTATGWALCKMRLCTGMTPRSC